MDISRIHKGLNRELLDYFCQQGATNVLEIKTSAPCREHCVACVMILMKLFDALLPFDGKIRQKN